MTRERRLTPGAEPAATGTGGRGSRLLGVDVLRLCLSALQVRPLRTVLSALGVAVGVASMVAVVGISTSSRAEVDRQLDRLGTNLLTVSPGSTMLGGRARLPERAAAMVGRLPPVEKVVAVGAVDAHVYSSPFVAAGQTGSIEVLAVQADLPSALAVGMARGRWLGQAAQSYPAVVLGSTAARRLGVPAPGARVWLGGTWFGVVGILEPALLAPEIDTAVLVGWACARDYLAFDLHPTTVYARVHPAQVEAVRAVLATAANPAAPLETRVSRPSDALAAQRATQSAWQGLLVRLAAVALTVGGIGVANSMVVSVLERRAEVGLRRCVGATRGHIRRQFLAEAVVLTAIGAACGAVIAIVITAAYATSRGWPTVVPAWVLVAGVVSSVPVGALAGLYPAVRAARVAPAEALTSH